MEGGLYLDNWTFYLHLRAAAWMEGAMQFMQETHLARRRLRCNHLLLNG